MSMFKLQMLGKRLEFCATRRPSILKKDFRFIESGQHRMAKTTSSPTSAQSLGALIKSARDIMRKDKGLNGDLDRLPMLTWVMFLKFIDDHEQVREERA